MEPRKIQSIGKYTFTISLPKEWVRNQGLKQGDAITIVTEKDGSLRLAPKGKIKEGNTEYVINADLCNKPNLLKRMLIGSYILGYDVIKIVSNEKISYNHIEEIQSVLPRLMGIAVIEESANQIIIQGLMEPRKFSVENLIKRLHTLTSMMQKEAVDALSSLDVKKAKDVIRLEKDSDMVYWLILKQLELASQNPTIANEFNIEDINHSIVYGNIATRLENIGDRAENIAKISLELKMPLPESCAQHLSYLGKHVFQAYERALYAFFKGDIRLANEVIESLREIRNIDWMQSKKMCEHMDAVSLVAYTTVLHYLKSMASDIARIGEIAINREIL